MIVVEVEGIEAEDAVMVGAGTIASSKPTTVLWLYPVELCVTTAFTCWTAFSLARADNADPDATTNRLPLQKLILDEGRAGSNTTDKSVQIVPKFFPRISIFIGVALLAIL